MTTDANEQISKKLCANEVLNTVKFYSYFMYIGVFASFFILMLYILDTMSGTIASVLSAFVFLYGVWKSNSTMKMIKGKYGL